MAERAAKLQDMVAGLESFNRSVSHDLRGPLGGMAHALQLALLRDARTDGGPADEALPVTVLPLPMVNADPGLLRQVFVNLIGNAIEFSADAAVPRVEVGARQLQGQTVFHVRNNGVGFDAAAAARLFEPFQRLHGTRFAGSGIGLSIVRRIVERHGGRLWAESQPGRGATFSFTLGAAT